MNPPRWVVLLVLAIVALPLAMTLAMGKNLNHDEHQHVAAGALLAREGLLPYRDYPHFHTPYLAAIYAPLFRLFGGYPLLVARMFSALCATAILALVSALAFAEFRARGARVAWQIATAILALGLSSLLFIDTTGRAWNHEPALLLALLASLLLARGWRSGHAGWFAAAGAMLGLCIGVRITYAPLIAPFGLVALFGAGVRRWKLLPAVTLSAGLLASLLPLAALYALDREAFIFSNWEFANVNIEYRMATGEPRTMTLGRKARYLWKEILRSNLPLLFAATLPWIAAWRARAAPRREWVLLLGLLPFSLIGMLAPSPSFKQYFYPLVPFGLLVAIYGLASLPTSGRVWRWAPCGLIACAAVSVALHAASYRKLPELLSPREWTPVEVHRSALALRKDVPAGTVLTLAPIHPLEAGLRIDPSFASGPFSWRISRFVDPAKAQRLGMVTPASLAAHLAAHPPTAILLGMEKLTEQPLIDYASSHGGRPVIFDGDETLWVMPRLAR